MGHELIVRNLPSCTRVGDLMKTFGRYGNILSVETPYDLHWRRTFGYAYIVYEDIRDAEAAMDELDESLLFGKEIEVRFNTRLDDNVEKRFVSISEEDLASLDNTRDSISVKQVVNRSVKLFRDFLEVENCQLENLPKDPLNNKLKEFFASLRTVTGETLKKSTLCNMRYGLCKHVKETCDIDLYKEQITDHDPKRVNDLCDITYNVTTSCGLQHKVWFDIMYHLCRGRRENPNEMSQSTFEVKTDASGKEYVRHNRCGRHAVTIIDLHGAGPSADGTVGETRMYAQGGEMCPVSSFKKYMRVLNPGCSALWQDPIKEIQCLNTIWYYSSPLVRRLGRVCTRRRRRYRRLYSRDRSESPSKDDRIGCRSRIPPRGMTRTRSRSRSRSRFRSRSRSRSISRSKSCSKSRASSRSMSRSRFRSRSRSRSGSRSRPCTKSRGRRSRSRSIDIRIVPRRSRSRSVDIRIVPRRSRSRSVDIRIDRSRSSSRSVTSVDIQIAPCRSRSSSCSSSTSVDIRIVPRESSPTAEESSPKPDVYVDNAQNRKLGRVGLPRGSCVARK